MENTYRPRAKVSLSKIIIYLGLTLGAIISVFPFYWLFVVASNKTDVMFRYPPKISPGGQLFHNIALVFHSIPIVQAFGNTLFVSVVTTVLTLLFCSMAAFAFAKLHFYGKHVLFVILLLTMMVPWQLGLVPGFIIVSKLGWINSFKALIIPNAVSAFGIFLLRQFIGSSVSDELIYAARIDGCNNFQIYWRMVLPLIRPGLGTLGIITFVGVWNDYMWPLVVLSDQQKYTLQVLISSLMGPFSQDYAVIMPATMLVTLPLIIIFLVFNRQFVSGLAAGSGKE